MENVDVLIADDSALILKVVKRALLENKIENYSFNEDNIYTAKNGVEAFETLGKHKNISMLISDVNMPFLNGDDLVEVLVDTNLNNKIKTIFITSNESSIKTHTKKYTLGTIPKPFNSSTFNEKLNSLLHRSVKAQESRCQEQIEQRLFIIKAINKLCEEKKFKQLPEYEIEDILYEYFDNREDILEEDIEFLFHSIVAELFPDANLKLKDIIHAYQETSSPLKETLSELYLKENILTSARRSRQSILSKKEIRVQEIYKELTDPINLKVALLENKSSDFATRRYRVFNPYADFLIEFFEKIDFTIRDHHLNELFFHKKEILEFKDWIREFCQEDRLLDEIPELEKSPALKKDVYERYMEISNTLSQVLNHMVGEIIEYMFYKAFLSKDIKKHLKKLMPNTIPNATNILLKNEQIDTKEAKQLQSEYYKNIVVLSSNMDFLRRFKQDYENSFSNIKLYCFCRTNLFETWLETHKVDKLFVDYSFTNSIFKDGIQYLKYFSKKYKNNKKLRSLIRFGRYNIIIKRDDILKERKNIKSLNTHILQNPMNKADFEELILYT